jgi:hypothetical protein
MPSKRDEIRENAKRADALAQQLAAEGGLFPSEGSKSKVFTNQIPDLSAPTTEPVAEVASEPQAESQPVEAATSPSANETQPAETVEDGLVSEKQYKSAVKAMNEAQRKAADADRLLKQQAEEHERFKAELQAIKQQMSQPAQVNNVSLVNQALERWKEEYPDTVSMNLETANAVKQEVEQLINSRLSTVEQQIKSSREEQERFKALEQIRLRDERIKQHHNDYDDVRLSDDFKTWIYGEAPSIYQGVYEGTIPFNDRDAVKIIDDFKAYKGSVDSNKPVVSRPKPSAAEVSPKINAAVSSDMGQTNEPEFTAEDLQRLPYMINRIKNPAERKALMDKADKFMSRQLSKTK